MAHAHNVSFHERLEFKHRNQNTVKATCHILKEDYYGLFCKSHYIDEIIIKYRDRLVPKHAPYSIFRSVSDPNRYIIAFEIATLKHCTKLKLLTSNILLCLSPHYQLIPMDWTHVHCFPFSVQYVDDMIKACLRLMNSNRHGKMEKNAYSALMYTPAYFKEPSASITGQQINLALFVVVAMLLVMGR